VKPLRGRFDFPTLRERAIAYARAHKVNKVLIEVTELGRALVTELASVGLAPSQPRPPKVAPPMAWDEAAGLILSTGPRYWRFVAAGSHFTAPLWLAITGTRPPTA
jgi:hypothetical protein